MGLSYLTAGESHGPGLIAVVSGLPAGLEVDVGLINTELARRQGGYGRGGRQNIETDVVEVLSGVRLGRTMGSPVALRVANKDSRLDDQSRTPPLRLPRPGHADLAGAVKYLTTDCRDTLERASARETAARVAAGALSRSLLGALGVEVFGFVRSIGVAGLEGPVGGPGAGPAWRAARDASETYCPDPGVTQAQREAIRQAKIDRTTLGGVIECHGWGMPPGLGSCMDWRDKLDARLAYAVMGIQAIKGVEIGLGFGAAALQGHQVHDAVRFDAAARAGRTLGFERPTNSAGGTEGGMTTGQPVVVRAAMKPIATLLRGMPSVDLSTLRDAASAYERSDVCAVPAASVVLENVVAFELARVVRDKFAGDSWGEVADQFGRFLDAARRLPLEPWAGG
ncbi:MAG: chorismate synthase [Planctomyces sp.]|nr:chorismate synthase [Planctomyces sp.]MBA4039670.1 chorismate synthase [Planctomyces sp.]MBA4120416.1 chorismate synthase [Isosphaera sp.]